MIRVYRYNGDEYVVIAQVNEDDGAVYGTSWFADYLRNAFEEIRAYGYDPANHMTKIRNRLENSYHNGIYLIS
jgi:uncharacterized membrane protein